MQIVRLGSNGLQISKKVSGSKDITQINKLTLKPVINEQFKDKNTEQTQQRIQKFGN